MVGTGGGVSCTEMLSNLDGGVSSPRRTASTAVGERREHSGTSKITKGGHACLPYYI